MTFKQSLLILICSYSALWAQKKPVELGDIWVQYQFYPKGAADFAWMKNDSFYTELLDGEIKKYQVLDRNKNQLLVSGLKDMENQKNLKIDNYVFSGDESKILITTESQSIYRHSTKEKCFVYDLKTKELKPIHKSKLISLATFSPDGNQIAYTFENNLYVTNLQTSETKQITSDGKWNFIINGSTDWVYEEEFSFAQAFSWSKDGKKIAYYRFDESQVKEFQMDMYGSLYPERYSFKYPKAGENNAIVDIFVYDLLENKSIKMDIGAETDQYVPRIRWTNDSEKLAILRMNRLQNQLDVLINSTSTGESKLILTEKDAAYVEITDYLLYFMDNGTEFLWTSEKTGYNHVYLYDLNGKMIRQITHGNWEVAEVKGVDFKKKTLYYTSNEISSLEKRLYKIQLDGSKKQLLSSEKGDHSVTMSGNCSFYIDTYSELGIPPITRLCAHDGKVLQTLEDNKELNTRLSTFNLSKPQFLQIPSQGQMLNSYMIRPSNFDSTQKYPVLMYVYGGPGHNTVVNRYDGFNYFWFQMLANQGYIVISVDNRGTGSRGAAFKKSTYKQLGKLEAEDQIEVAKWLGAQKYVDKSRIGIWGWSFGGYLTTLCLTKGAEYFKAGIAVAPVTNWRFYDTIYTERYLQKPQDNPEGYDENSPINFTKNLKSKYLLIHGTADDNVHCQNAWELVNSLVKNNIQFDMFFYPNKNHGIAGGMTRFHLYNKMTNFLIKNL